MNVNCAPYLPTPYVCPIIPTYDLSAAGGPSPYTAPCYSPRTKRERERKTKKAREERVREVRMRREKKRGRGRSKRTEENKRHRQSRDYKKKERRVSEIRPIYLYRSPQLTRTF